MTGKPVTVYEKPTCTTCRKVKKVLLDQGVEFEAIDYFEQPLSVNLLRKLLQNAGIKPSDALRRNEPEYRDYVAGKELTDEQLLKLMVEHPSLIQRPIVARGDRAIIARPIEKLADLKL